MGYGSIAGRARTSARNPQAHAICDRCGFRYNHVRLQWQMDWAGPTLINKRLLVCDSCLDVPQEQLRAIAIPADPMPIQNPRPENFVSASSNQRITQGNSVDAETGIPVVGGQRRLTEEDELRFTQQTGGARGSLNEMPGVPPDLPAEIGGDDPGLPYQNDEIPETGPI